jgi:hypothetical protein
MSPLNAGFAYKASNAPPPLEVVSGPGCVSHGTTGIYPTFASFAPSPNLLGDFASEHAVITRSRGHPDVRRRAATAMYSSVVYESSAPSANFGSVGSVYGSVGSQSTLGGSFGTISTCNAYGSLPAMKQLDVLPSEPAPDDSTAQSTELVVHQDRSDSPNSCLSQESVSVSSLAETRTTFSGSKRPHACPSTSTGSPAKRSRFTTLDPTKVDELQQLVPGWDMNCVAEMLLQERSAALGVEPLEVVRYLILQYINKVELYHIRPFAAVKNSKAGKR